ncbi:MAG: phosphate signaling complex protein PhoU [Actinobacteria bacterium]|nr:phosphate signaling complex protein PhoU [Actinomycetota bacterium]
MRNDFHAEMDRLIDELLSVGETVIEMLDRSVESVSRHDVELADTVIRMDNDVDAVYADVQQRLVRTMALQAPVASDLRLLSAMLHIDIHLERMGDYAVNIAKMGKLSAAFPGEPELVDQLREMRTIAIDVARRALAAFTHRNLEAAYGLPAADAAVNRLNIGMFHRLVRLASRDESYLEWATRMILVARQLERWSDHAVDIGEATIFAVTGETVELSSNAPPDTAEAGVSDRPATSARSLK